MTYTIFRKSLTQKILEYLEPFDFLMTASDILVRRKSTHEINCIWIQKHSSKPMVCINLGAHYDFIPLVGNRVVEINNIEQQDCEIKHRLTPNELQNDYWWTFGTSEIKEITNLIMHRALPYFERYDLKGEIGSINPKDCLEKVPDLLSDMTKVRACLLMSRIYEEYSETSFAAEFARLGIESAGMAVGPKKELREILKRLE